MKNRMIIVGLAMLATLGQYAHGDEAGPLKIELLGVRKIWDEAPHNAFTDLVRWRDRFYCAFREGEGHAGDIGRLRIIASDDGDQWKSVAALAMPEFDLRDAALSVTPDDRLMVLGGAQQNYNGQRATGTFVSFTADGVQWTRPQVVIPPGRWLWRVTWLGDSAYGVSYAASEGKPFSTLHRTGDGVHYETVVPELLGQGGWPTEARIRFSDEGTAYCLHRRDGSDGNTAYLGTSLPPYRVWQWQNLGVRLGGPNMIHTPLGVWIAAGRLYDGGARTALAELDVDHAKLTPLITLPSGGDTSYPGLVWYDDMLWISYYSSHEDHTSVYLARVRVTRP